MADQSQSQRDFIRKAIWRLVEQNKAALAEEYALAEEQGVVPRQSNEYGMDARKYGERLIDDARRKGWL
jgi:hypothetical protein